VDSSSWLAGRRLTGVVEDTVATPGRRNHRKRIYLAGIGNGTDPRTYSGIPFYLAVAAKRSGVIDEVLPTGADGFSWRLRRWAWNAGKLFSDGSVGGFQYSNCFLERLYAPYRAALRNNVLLSFTQILPESIIQDSNIEKRFFIDCTLQQLFQDYGNRVGGSSRNSAIKREMEGYRKASLVVVNSEYAARSVVSDYTIQPDKVFAVPQGANISAEEYDEWEGQRKLAWRAEPSPELKLVFVGKYWHRKGLDRLLRGLTIGRRRGLRARLRVIGCAPDDLPPDLKADTSMVEWIPFLDKRSEMKRFIHLVGECEVGCLLSRKEAGGVAFREYHALGLIVLGTAAGGAPDQMVTGAAIIVPVEASDEAIAEILLSLQRDRMNFKRLRETAWSHRREALWLNTVERLAQLWQRLDGAQLSQRTGS